MACIAKIDSERRGIGITCPYCLTLNWVVLPAQRQGNVMPLKLACPKACGYYGDVDLFAPRQLTAKQIADFDVEYVCRRDMTITRSFGKFLRCPFCAYENCREIMRDLTVFVDAACVSEDLDRDGLADILSRIVSTFDGVMRICNLIAVRNYKNGSIYAMKPVTSFQNPVAARDKMLPDWDMAVEAGDWQGFVLAFQKRHCFMHTLGLADQAYIDKTGDTTAVVGRNIKLTVHEVISFARQSENIVSNFFGQYFS